MALFSKLFRSNNKFIRYFCTKKPNESSRFIPTKPLSFINGKSIVFVIHNPNFIRNMYLFGSSIAAFFIGLSSYQLYHYKNRDKLILGLSLLGFCYFSVILIASTQQIKKFIIKIALAQDGKTIYLTSYRMFSKALESKFDISQIKFIDDIKIYEMTLGVPIEIENKLFIIPRILVRNELKHEEYEILNAICSGKYIQTETESESNNSDNLNNLEKK